MSRGDHDDSGWSWHWSPITGIMYGPVPVGIIGVGILVIVYLAFFNK